MLKNKIDLSKFHFDKNDKQFDRNHFFLSFFHTYLDQTVN